MLWGLLQLVREPLSAKETLLVLFQQEPLLVALLPQIYQFLLEGVLLFVLLWLYARRPRASGQVAAAFLGGYGLMRFIAEYFREPDAHLGLLWLSWSMGQWLCVPMVLGGALLWVWAKKAK